MIAAYRSTSTNHNKVVCRGEWIHVIPSVSSTDCEGSTTPTACEAIRAIVFIVKLDTIPQIMNPEGKTTVTGGSVQEVMARVLDH